MIVTLTRRTDKALREALRRRAATPRRSITDVVRETLDEALIERRADLRAARLLTALLRRQGEAARKGHRRVR